MIMKKLLIAGLIISIISVLFNVFVYTYYSNHISEKENKISFLKSRNLMLSIEYANAEHTSFFSDYYAIEKMSLLNLPKSEIDKDYLRALNIRRDMSLAESLKIAISSSAPLSKTFLAKVTTSTGSVSANTLTKSFFTPLRE